MLWFEYDRVEHYALWQKQLIHNKQWREKTGKIQEDQAGVWMYDTSLPVLIKKEKKIIFP